MAVNAKDLEDLWFEEFLGPAEDPRLCGLCGNSGALDTRDRVFSAAGVSCGVLAFCICPNGRALRAAGADLVFMGDQIEGARLARERGQR